MISPSETDSLAGWPQTRAHLRQMFSELTDDDLVLVEGREEHLIAAIEQKTGRPRAVVVDAFRACGMFSAGALPPSTVPA